jgi:hypothetical protein
MTKLAGLHKKHILTIALVLIITVIALEVFVAQAATPKWDIQVIDMGNVDRSSSIALDSIGNPHICYSEATYFSYGSSQANPMKYASIVGKNWTIQIIDNYGYFPSLAFDLSGYPHISYVHLSRFIGENSTLNYASWNGSAWNIQTVEEYNYYSDSGLTHTNMVLDSSGNPHITYIVDSPRLVSLKYAFWNGSAWNIQTIDQGIAFNQSPNLVLDSKNNPHITYAYAYTDKDKLYGSTYDTEGLKYASWNETEWDIQIIAKPAGSCSLVLDKNDNPHVSYGSSNGLAYAILNGSKWEVQTIAEGEWGADTSLSLDSNGYPFICYNHFPNLKYAFWNGTDWTIGRIDYNNNVRANYGLVAVVLDSYGNPHVSYTNDSGGIRFGTCII